MLNQLIFYTNKTLVAYWWGLILDRPPHIIRTYTPLPLPPNTHTTGLWTLLLFDFHSELETRQPTHLRTLDTSCPKTYFNAEIPMLLATYCAFCLSTRTEYRMAGFQQTTAPGYPESGSPCRSLHFENTLTLDRIFFFFFFLSYLHKYR